MYLGSDTGTMHMAAAMGTPCVAIFNAKDAPGQWHPCGNGHKILRTAPPCEGCGMDICPKPVTTCLDDITVDDVLRACECVLASRGTHSPP